MPGKIYGQINVIIHNKSPCFTTIFFTNIILLKSTNKLLRIKILHAKDLIKDYFGSW